MADRGPGTSSAAGTLEGFWTEAGVSSDRLPYLRFQARRYPSIAAFLEAHGPWKDRTVLDLGGGIGSLAVTLRERLGGTYHVADFFPASPALATALAARGVPRTYPVDLNALDPLSTAPGPYDTLLFVEVLEHLLVNPVLLFRALRTHLAPGGLLFLTTPNQARVSNRWRFLKGRSIKEPGRYPLEPGGVYGHVIEYTRDELTTILGHAGFDPVASRIVQQVPTVTPSRVQRAGVRLLNSGWASRGALGDDILALYRRHDRPLPSAPPGARV